MSDASRTGAVPDPAAGEPCETETQQAVKRIVPWVVSVGIHAGLIGLGFLVTWTVVNLGDEEPVLVVAQFDALSYDPLVKLETQPLPPQEQTPEAAEPSESLT